jgi:hypothetical protein
MTQARLLLGSRSRKFPGKQNVQDFLQALSWGQGREGKRKRL